MQARRERTVSKRLEKVLEWKKETVSRGCEEISLSLSTHSEHPDVGLVLRDLEEAVEDGLEKLRSDGSERLGGREKDGDEPAKMKGARPRSACWLKTGDAVQEGDRRTWHMPSERRHRRRKPSS